MKKRTLTACITAFLIVGLAVGYVGLTAPQRRIGRFLEETAKVEIGMTRLNDWREQLQAAHVKDSSVSCDENACRVSEEAQVRMLHRLRLAPLSGISASVTFKDGVASEVDAYLEVEDRDVAGAMEPGTGATIHESTQSRSCPQHYCSYVKERWGHPWGVVEMDSGASGEDRAKAFAINTGCLTRIGGCRKLEVILPHVFAKK